MARDHARVNLDIWNDPDFRALPLPAQHLYLVLWTHPDLTYCGSLDWRPARLSGLTEGTGREGVELAAQCLQARHFLVIDEGTEEALVRSWIKFDGLMKQPRMAISCITAYGAMGSDTLRKVIVHELMRVREALPDLSAWNDDRVSRVLDHPSISAKALPTPNDPFGDGLTHSVTPGLAQTEPKGKGSVCTPPTPAPTPATSSSSPSASRPRRSPERPIPEDWKPSTAHQDYADSNGLDLSTEAFKFRNHAHANDRRQRDWDASFRMWLAKAKDFAPQRGKRQATQTDGRPMPEAWQ